MIAAGVWLWISLNEWYSVMSRVMLPWWKDSPVSRP